MDNNQPVINLSTFAVYYQNLSSPFTYDVNDPRHRQRAQIQLQKKADRGTLDLVILKKAKAAYIDALEMQIEKLLKRIA
jgi:hypothetical protein